MSTLKEFLSFEIDMSKTIQEADQIIARYKQLKVDVGGVRSEMEKLKDKQRELQKQALETNDTKAAKEYRKEANLIGVEIKGLTDMAKGLDKEMQALNKDFAGAKPAVGTYTELAASLKKLQFERQNIAPIGSDRFKELTTETASIISQLKSLDGQVGQFQRNVGNYRNEIVNAFGDLGFDDLAKQQVAVVREEAEKARTEAIKLAQEYRDALNIQGGKTQTELEEIKNKAEQAAIAAGHATAQLEQIDNVSLNGIKSQLKEAFSIQGILKQGVGIAVAQIGVDSVLQGLSQGVNFLRDISKVQGDVVRLNSALSKSDIADITNDLKQIDTSTGLKDLLKIASLGGQFGVAKKDVKGFTEAIDAVNVSLGDEFGGNVDEVTKQVGKLAVLYGDTTKSIGQNVQKTGSLLNAQSADLSNVTAGFLADFSLRVAGTAKTFQLSLAQVAGFGSILEQSGVGVEKAGTAINTIFNGMAKNFQLYARELGLSAAETVRFKNLINTDANSALIFFLQNLKNTTNSATEFQTKLSNLKITGDGEVQSLNALANNIEGVTNAQKIANKSFAEGTGVTDEKTKSLQTLDGILNRLENKLVNVLASPTAISALEKLGSGAIVLVDALLKLIDVLGYLGIGFDLIFGKGAKLIQLISFIDFSNIVNNFKQNVNAWIVFANLLFEKLKPIYSIFTQLTGRKNLIDFQFKVTASPPPDFSATDILGKSGAGKKPPTTATDIAARQSELEKQQKQIDLSEARKKEKAIKSGTDEKERIAELNTKKEQLELDSQKRLSEAQTQYQNSLLDSSQNFNDKFLELANARNEEVGNNKEAYEKDKANLNEQLREKVLTKTQYNKLLADLDEALRLSNLAAENEYNKKIKAAQKERNDAVLSSQKELTDALIDLQKTKVDGKTATQKRLLTVDIIEAQSKADIGAQQQKIKSLEVELSIVPNDTALINELNKARIDLENIVAKAANETSSVISDIFTADLEEGIAEIENRFSDTENKIKNRAAIDTELAGAGPGTETTKAAIAQNEQTALLVSERAGLEARKSLYNQYLANLATDTQISAADRESIERDLAEKIKQINGEIADSDRQISSNKVQVAQKSAEQEKEIRDAVFNSIQQLESAAFDSINKNIDNKLQSQIAALEEQKSKELQIFGTTQQKRNEIEQRYAAQQKTLQKQANEQKKEAAIAQALINGFLAITNILAQNAGNPILAGILVGTTVALTAIEIANIKKQQFGRGGLVGGKYHTEGGTPIEAERGEAIVTRTAMGRYPEIVSAVNQAGGGVRMPGTKLLTENSKALLNQYNNIFSGKITLTPNMAPTIVHINNMKHSQNGNIDMTTTNELLNDTHQEIRNIRLGMSKIQESIAKKRR